MFRLICIDGFAVGEEIVITNPITKVGRNDDNDICILDSEVSRNHCTITILDNGIEIQDLNSRNGIYINEVHQQDSYKLNPCDLIRLGNTTYMLYDDDNPPGNYEEIKKILSKAPKQPQEVMMNILALQMSQTVVIPKDSIPKKNF